MKRQPWVQPQGRVEFDERNPLTTGLLWAMVGDHAIGAGAEPRPDVGSSDAYYGAGNGHQGKHLGNSGTTSSRPFTFHSRNVVARMGATDQWTLYVIRRTTDTTDNGFAGLISVSWLDGVWGPNWAIADLRRQNGTDGFQITNAYGSGSSSSVNLGANNPPWFDSNWHSIGLTRAGAFYQSYKNGEPKGSATGTAGAQSPASGSDDDIYVLGYASTSGYSQCGEVAFAAIWDRTLSADEMRALEQDPYQVLRPAVRMPTFKSAGGGGTITGTGAATIAAATASGTAEREITGTGTPAAAPATASGTAEREVTGTGAATAAAATAAGTAERTITGTGAVTTTPATAAGTAEREITGTGAATAAAATAAGTGAVGDVIIGSGTPVIAAATASGTAEREITGTGAAAAAAVAAAGSATRRLTGTGAVSLAAFTASGIAIREITGSGAATIAAATAAGFQFASTRRTATAAASQNAPTFTSGNSATFDDGSNTPI